MDILVLRILTWKSKLNFGKYKELTIQEIFDLHHTQYLRYLYYNRDSISFIEEILIGIGIVSSWGDDRIEKPGIDPEKGKWLDRLKFNNLTKIYGAQNAVNKMKQLNKHHMNRIVCNERLLYSKGNLQRMNQGNSYKKF